jgi:predicted TIM-barrel fold metal-dependent hydrolase
VSQSLWDADVLFGFWPSSRVDMSLAAVRALLVQAGTERAVACSARGALSDDADGNAETLDAAARHPELIPAGTVDLRDCLNCAVDLAQLVDRSVRLLRLFPLRQNVPPQSPAVRYVLSCAARAGLPVLMDGPVPQYADPVRGTGATVVFLDLHAYHVADFVVLAREEPGVLGSTRLLNGPDSITQVVNALGPDRLVYGSRTPLDYAAPSRLVLRAADISNEARDAIAQGNLRRLLEVGVS